MNSLDYQSIFHEIKNTVTLVNSSMQLLDSKCTQLQSEHYWTNLKQEVTYLKNMVLEISQAGNLEQLQKEPVQVNSIIQNICQNMTDTYPDLKWDLQLEDKLPAISGDSIKLRQAILNLLKNSAEAQNGLGYITVITKTAGKFIEISIADHGGGVPAEIEGKIFNMFITSKKQGTGLGLPIAKQIFECHGGTIQFQNTCGKGCTFTCMLPIT